VTDTATLTTRLSEAEAALHKMLVGETVVRVTKPDGSAVDFAVYDQGVTRLRAYIIELKSLLGQTGGRAAHGVRFG